VKLTVNGVPAPVQYVGGASGLVGVYQINFQLPTALPGDTTGGGTATPTWEVKLTAAGQVVSFQIPVK